MTTYLITGGAGFIGSNFIHYLFEVYGGSIEVINLDSLTYASDLSNLDKVSNNWNYHFVQGDICDISFVEGIFSEYNVDYVIHFAAETHVDNSIYDGKNFVATNVMGTYNLIHCAKNSWYKGDECLEKKKFIYISTDEVYGHLGSEGYFTEDLPVNPRNPYSASKASGELLAKSFYDTYGFPVIRTRCTNNYGPHQHEEKLVPLCIKRCLDNELVPVYGDGLAVRDWLHVKDHCRAIEMIAQKGMIGEIYNIGSNNEKTTIDMVMDIVHLINKLYNENMTMESITFVEDRKGHDRRYAIDYSKLREELGFEPMISYEEGMLETIKWYYNKWK